MIFWEKLKGLNKTSATDAPDIVTYINFQKSDSLTTGQDMLPSIQVTGPSGLVDYGHILTDGEGSTGTFEQEIKGPIAFNNNVVIGPTNSSTTCTIHANTTVNGTTTHNNGVYINDHWLHLIGSDNTANIPTIRMQRTITGVEKTSFIDFNGTNIGIKVGNTRNIYFDAAGGTNSVYFNATSDRRAKINLQPLDLSAVDLICKTPLYSFDYKDLDMKSIGIIAQDVQNVDLNGFKLIDNEFATGKDMDYMTIHESKLIYILWKAIQEQQEQINRLLGK